MPETLPLLPIRTPAVVPAPAGAAATACSDECAARCTDSCCAPAGPPAAVVTTAITTTAGPAAPAGRPAPGSPAWLRAARAVRALSWLSLAWMGAEGVLGLVAGIRAGSVSLLGWALGSVIEALASVIVIWRFTGTRTRSETSERVAQRAVAVSFLLLAPFITVEAVRDLLTGHTAGPTVLGVVVTAVSLLAMPALGVVKRRLGTVLGSGATAGEGTQNLLCAAQAAAVLLGLAATAALGWSWVDPVIALALAAWAVREGRAAWRGEDCC